MPIRDAALFTRGADAANRGLWVQGGARTDKSAIATGPILCKTEYCNLLDLPPEKREMPETSAECGDGRTKPTAHGMQGFQVSAEATSCAGHSTGESPRWFPELLAQRARTDTDRLVYRFFQGSMPPRTLTFGELWRDAASLAHELVDRGWAGERALLVCNSEHHFVVAFHACLLAGVIVVPTAPPRRQTLHQRFQLLADDSGAVAILCDYDDAAQTASRAERRPLAVLDLRTMQPAAGAAAAFRPVPRNGSDLAFLQYTSGSTGEPKGVAISHANLIANSERIRQAMALTPSSSVLIGLPLFHDMGLVGGVLQAVYVGFSCGFMSPAELVQHPKRWLQLVSTFRITTIGGPNFIYELAASVIRDEDLQGLDLSSCQVAFCGAEPIRASTMSRFMRRFAPAGFEPAAFFPCYGMAEATLFIAGGPAGRHPDVVRRDRSEVVCCGEPASGHRVRIVDPRTRRALAEGEVGEIWVHGDSVAQGYWGRTAATEETFRARVLDDTSHDDGLAYLRTGDLGWLQDGRLYVSGRLKDIIIVNGRKYAPHDLEEAVEQACAGVRSGGVIAFGVQSTEAPDRLVVVVELERQALRQTSEWGRLASSIRSAVHAAQGLTVADVVFLKPGGLPRTSSGKIRRSQCRDDYLAGRFEAPPLTA
ncbi:fatty acyl-AMP ligase [Variovorax boronicumulans]|uniref:fatty acyl-AMP ligase n=1 Tax=Variovorax boronicumulans TaxID=436515 RepID=UPI0033984A8A